MEQWYVVHTKPRQEALALENLARQGYIAYCPRIAQAKRCRKHWQQVHEPLFPRYLFIRLAVGQDDFTPIRSTLGVHGLVRFGLKPAVISPNTIKVIHRQEQRILGQAGSRPNWQAGDRIEIACGPFAGLKGTFHKTRGAERVMILLDILGRQNRITIDTHSVVPAA